VTAFRVDVVEAVVAPDVWTFNDGGRAAAGFKGHAGDCVTRAIAIATGRPYAEVYEDLAERARDWNGRRHRKNRRPRTSPREGVQPRVIRDYLADAGWEWTPTMRIGSGTTVHLRADELPGGVLIVNCSRHLVAVIDGVAHDTHDPTREGTRCVYGYWTAPR
jgi:hypothetical protein